MNLYREVQVHWVRHRIGGGIGSEGRKGECKNSIAVELGGGMLMVYAVPVEKKLVKVLDFSMQL